jgi:MtaA/CmuA family methyltransferase
MSHHEKLRSLLSAKVDGKAPVFSGLIHVTEDGLASEGLAFHDIHHDAQKMARAAASTFRLAGIPSATLPLDLCAPAEVLGAELNFYEGSRARFPQVKKAIFESTREIVDGHSVSPGIGLRTGRLESICEALALLKRDIGSDAIISGLIPGPYTLLLYLCNPAKLFIEMKKEPHVVQDALRRLSTFLAQFGREYFTAGADFITIHEMGGSPGFLGPVRFEQFVFPALKQLTSELPKPAVLSVCGDTNKSMHLLGQAGAEAVSVDQLNDLATSRETMPNTLLFGNIDPVQTLAMGNQKDIHDAMDKALDAGVDALWPGCDLVLGTPTKNLQTFIEYGRK